MKKPTPEEIQDSGRLASWLEGETEQSVEADVLEAIYIISPERCPAPRVRIEDILGRVASGPFGEGEETAGGTEEDAEYVRELLLHTAHIPKTSLNDILSRVQSGPFASQEKQFIPPEESLEEAEDLPDNVVPLRAWWQRTEVALFAAAAVALLILIPSNFQLTEQASQKDLMLERPKEEQKMPPPMELEAEELREPASPTAERGQFAPKKKAASRPSIPNQPSPAEASPSDRVANRAVPETLRKEPGGDVIEKKAEKRREVDRANDQGAVASSEDIGSIAEPPAPAVVVADSMMDDQDDLNEREDFPRGEQLTPLTFDSAPEEPEADELFDEIVVADADIVLEEEVERMEKSSPAVVEELALRSSVQQGSIEREKKEGFRRRGRKKSAAQTSMSVAAAPARENADITEDEPSTAILSANEKQQLQGYTSPAEIVSYARQFTATKALVVLWHGTVNRDNQFAIAVLKASEEFGTGQKIYLERNYQLLISLLLLEGEEAEAQKYRAKLNALQ